MENYELLTGLPGDDDDAVYMGKMEELNALCDKILTTRARTFEAARLQYRMVVQELGVDKGTAGEKGLLLLRGFVLDVERALKRRGRLAEVEAELRLAEHMAPPTAG